MRKLRGDFATTFVEATINPTGYSTQGRDSEGDGINCQQKQNYFRVVCLELTSQLVDDVVDGWPRFFFQKYLKLAQKVILGNTNKWPKLHRLCAPAAQTWFNYEGSLLLIHLPKHFENLDL